MAVFNEVSGFVMYSARRYFATIGITELLFYTGVNPLQRTSHEIRVPFDETHGCLKCTHALGHLFWRPLRPQWPAIGYARLVMRTAAMKNNFYVAAVFGSNIQFIIAGIV